MLVEGSRAGNGGKGLNKVGHAWNIVRIDGEYYHVDATLHNAISRREKKLIFQISDYDSTAYDIEKMIIEAAEKNNLNNGIKARWTINEAFGILDIEFEY